MNDQWVNSVLESASEKAQGLKQVLLANQLYSELESLPLNQVLANHLPASDSVQIQAASDEIQNGVDEVYDGLNAQVTDAWVEATLNSSLEHCDVDHRGKYLVSLIRCFEMDGVDALQKNSRWQEIQNQENFQPQDVTELLALAASCASQNAGFLARQEFLVMEHTLDKLPYELVEAQMGSGPRYALAYAASMYITEKQTVSPQQTDGQPAPAPYQLGLLAANAVESSQILAQYHFGKVRLEDAMVKLRALAGRMLAFAGKAALQAMAFGLRIFESAVIARISFLLLTVAGVTSTTALWVIPLLAGTLIFLNFPQQEAVGELMAVWDGVKSLLSALYAQMTGLLKGNQETAASIVEEASPEDTENTVPPCQNSQFVTV